MPLSRTPLLTALLAGVLAFPAPLDASGSRAPRKAAPTPMLLARVAAPTPPPEDTVLTTRDAPAAEPYRVKYGHLDLYVPTFFHADQGAYDLIVHFHGLSAAQESNVEHARVNAIVATMNVGVGSGPYEDAMKRPGAWKGLLRTIDRLVAKSGRAKGAHVGRIALEAWSAGYGAVSAILRTPSNLDAIDAVILADGLHTDYANLRTHKVDDAPLAKYARVAEAAIRGEKLFCLTHSSIHTDGYANTTETIGALLKLVDVPKVATVADGPRGMVETYESHRGNFHVKGYLGTTVKDHINHIWGMSETMLPYLRERWTPQPSRAGEAIAAREP